MKRRSRRIASLLSLLVAASAVLFAEVKPGARAPSVPPVLNLEDYRGQVVYLDFWASWCVPCRLSFPWMQEMTERLGPAGLKVVAVNLDEDRKAADRFLAKFPHTFSVVFDPAGASAETYGVPGMPTSFIIDRKGNVKRVHIGFSTTKAKAVAEELEALLKENVHAK